MTVKYYKNGKLMKQTAIGYNWTNATIQDKLNLKDFPGIVCVMRLNKKYFVWKAKKS